MNIYCDITTIEKRGDVEHHFDFDCWRIADDLFPLFAAAEKWNAVGMSSDGFGPHGREKCYSC